jgi:hypothetical protein
MLMMIGIVAPIPAFMTVIGVGLMGNLISAMEEVAPHLVIPVLAAFFVGWVLGLIVMLRRSGWSLGAKIMAPLLGVIGWAFTIIVSPFFFGFAYYGAS